MEPIVVIGAGVAGLTVATELSERGIPVAIIDEQRAPGPHQCSWWAGGMLAPWCERVRHDQPILRLGQKSIDWWSKKTEVHLQGTLVITASRDRNILSSFAKRTDGFVKVAKNEILALEPDLCGRFTEGLYFAKEAHLNARKALNNLRQLLLYRGCQFSQTNIESPGLQIDCRGLAAHDVLRDLRGVKGEMLIVRCKDVKLRRPIRFLHPRIPLYIVPIGDDKYILGATMIESDDRNCITVKSVLELLSAAYAIHPSFGEAEILETGVDSRPAFPDNIPSIRREGSTIYVNGLFRHGYLLAPALAMQVADLVMHETNLEEINDH